MAERLIDVEALKERIEDNCCDNCCDNCGGVLCSCCKVDDVFCVIEDAPTIEAKPVVHAHWTKFWNTFYMQNMYCCSKCGNNALTREETMFDQVLTKYCPYCGAQMDEGVKIPVISMEDVPKLMEEMEK